MLNFVNNKDMERVPSVSYVQKQHKIYMNFLSDYFEYDFTDIPVNIMFDKYYYQNNPSFVGMCFYNIGLEGYICFNGKYFHNMEYFCSSLFHESVHFCHYILGYLDCGKSEKGMVYFKGKTYRYNDEIYNHYCSENIYHLLPWETESVMLTEIAAKKGLFKKKKYSFIDMYHHVKYCLMYHNKDSFPYHKSTVFEAYDVNEMYKKMKYLSNNPKVLYT